MSEALVAISHVSHWFGTGELRRQVLFDISTEIHPGEIVIVTGPSGSGKTTLLTLIGALRSAQEGSLRVFGRELRNADEATLSGVREQIGYVFQSHNLIESLSAQQNVQMSLQLQSGLSGQEIRKRARSSLGAVGLEDRADDHPSQLSGGQRQRIALARALVRRPKIVLADEPTASLDGETGRSVVEMLERLARGEGASVILVTHDSRVFDVADRILTLEDGRLSSLMHAVASDTQLMLHHLIRDIERGDLVRQVSGLDADGFLRLLESVTGETTRLLAVADLVQSDAFERILRQVMSAFETQLRETFAAEHAAVYLANEELADLWSFGECEHGAPHEVHLALPPTPPDSGIRDADLIDHLRRRQSQHDDSVLVVPIRDREGRAIAALEVSRASAHAFSDADQTRLERFARALGLVFESWWRMSCTCRSGAPGELPPCCRAQ
jgi:putative ABC transport system ATP-binding protein